MFACDKLYIYSNVVEKLKFHEVFMTVYYNYLQCNNDAHDNNNHTVNL